MNDDDYYLSLNGKNTVENSYISKERRKTQRKYIGFCIFASLAISVPITCGLYSISNSITVANATKLVENLESINGNFKYIKSIDSNLESIGNTVEKLKEDYDMDQVDSLLTKLNYTLNKLIEILERIPEPPDIPPGISPINSSNITNSKVF